MKGLVTTVRLRAGYRTRMALERTWEMSVFSLKMLGKMIIGQVSWKNLSGPVTIADYAGQSAQLGIGAYIAFLALISIQPRCAQPASDSFIGWGTLAVLCRRDFKGSPVRSERWNWPASGPHFTAVPDGVSPSSTTSTACSRVNDPSVKNALRAALFLLVLAGPRGRSNPFVVRDIRGRGHPTHRGRERFSAISPSKSATR